MKKFIAALALTLPLLNAHAAYIVDTGAAGSGPYWVFDESQYFAAEFTTTQAYRIKSLESVFSSFGAGNVTFGISTDAGTYPGTSLFSKTVAFATDNDVNWGGAYDLDYRLEAGTYWITFVPDAAFRGAMPGVATTPLDRYAQGNYSNWYTGGATDYAFLKLAVRIDGEVAAPDSEVPEPATAALAGIAALGLIVSRKRKQGTHTAG